jgi:hypothetical protein
MSARHTIATLLAFCHLALVGCGAARITPLASDSRAGNALQTYCWLSGANTGYGFFAPGVAPQMRATFTLLDSAGRSRTVGPEEGSNMEVTHHLATINHLLSYPAVRGAICASWSGRMFSRYPDAEQIVVHVEMYALPTMDQYRTGHSPRWVTVYEGTFIPEPEEVPSLEE